MPDREDDSDVDVLELWILAGILNGVNGPIIAGTNVHNVMQENSQEVARPSGSSPGILIPRTLELIALELASFERHPIKGIPPSPLWRDGAFAGQKR